MYKKSLKSVFSFNTTEEAMTMEKKCREGGIPGRIIPTPAIVKAGCGLAWCAPAEDRQTIVDYCRENAIAYDKVADILI